MIRPRVIVHTVASVDGRVSLGPGRTGFDDIGDARWQAMWASDTALEDSVADIISAYRPQVLLEGSGSFVTEDEDLAELPPSEFDGTHLREDYLPEAVVSRPGHAGWFTVVDARGRVRAGMTEFPGWDGWRTLHLVAGSTPEDYLALLRRREIPYIVSGHGHVDLRVALEKMACLLGVSCVVCTAGSRLNGALLRANLIDEVSLVLLPALIGGLETPVLFRCADLGPTDCPTRLELMSMDGEPAGRLHLRYRVVSPEEVQQARQPDSAPR